MRTGYWVVGFAIAIGVVLIASEAVPEVVNALLILVLIGIILSRWGQIAPWVGLAGKVASGEKP